MSRAAVGRGRRRRLVASPAVATSGALDETSEDEMTSGSCKRIRKARRVKESIKEQNTCILITKVKKYTKCHLKQSANVSSVVLAKSTIGVL